MTFDSHDGDVVAVCSQVVAELLHTKKGKVKSTGDINEFNYYKN